MLKQIQRIKKKHNKGLIWNVIALVMDGNAIIIYKFNIAKLFLINFNRKYYEYMK